MLGDVWGEVSSQRYEELTGTSKGQYEQDLLVAARDTLMDFSGVAPLGTVESVRLDGNNEDVCVVVHFRAHHYPGRRFAWRFRVWPASEPGSDPYSSPDGRAYLLPVHLGEVINEIEGGGATAPDASGVEWLIWES